MNIDTDNNKGGESQRPARIVSAKERKEQNNKRRPISGQAYTKDQEKVNKLNVLRSNTEDRRREKNIDKNG